MSRGTLNYSLTHWWLCASIGRDSWARYAWYRSCVTWPVSMMKYAKTLEWWRYVNALSVSPHKSTDFYSESAKLFKK